ncbi:Fatty-acid-binding protein 1 [Platanthera guangdongensis]|uniref:Fatty-acid-binding protein 1 n=1 Tax=Platanthera guangdongensis TaxID=2320717 RepID=A0ABR2MCC8_9ASPA
MAVEPKTGVLFPTVIDGVRRLVGIGLRKKNVFGLKNIDVYAFGVYADAIDVNKLREKYGVLSESELKNSKEFVADVLDQDLRMTVRLQIVYGRLSIGSVRSAFEDSVGSRLKKFSGAENKELLQSKFNEK